MVRGGGGYMGIIFNFLMHNNPLFSSWVGGGWQNYNHFGGEDLFCFVLCMVHPFFWDERAI